MELGLGRFRQDGRWEGRRGAGGDGVDRGE